MAHLRAHIGIILGIISIVLVSLAACAGESPPTGAAFSQLPHILPATFNSSAAVSGPSCAIDTSNVTEGYVAAKGSSSSRLKLQVIKGEQSYNYDLPSDGSPIFAPINMGDGSYTFRIMKNTSGSNYVEILSTSADVKLADEFQPFLRPNVYSDFSDTNASTRLARELTAPAQTQAEAVKAICDYVLENISYDSAKAEKLSTVTGYVPDPDETLASKSGICFDYAALGTAMLRSVGIPCKLITGYVAPNDLYHAWIMVYIDGSWRTAEFSINPKQWSRVDLTFAASSSGPSNLVGNGKGYSDRYVY